MSALARHLRARVRLFALINAGAVVSWRGGEVLAAHTQGLIAGAGFVLSGIGLALWIVSAIILTGQVLHARKAGAFDLFRESWARQLHRDALVGSAAGAVAGYALALALPGTGAERLTLPVAGAIAGFLAAWVALDVRRDGRG
ncbi:MAG: hypothetical protein GC187_12370 [Alphaproteobacteria bacterium]|nr:hypothetical protein [Alphaproteobacteria bacterium]